MFRSIISILINVPIALIALSVHEFSHGLVSSKLGDPTPRYEGRLTLNPLRHLDLVGTLLMILTGFGWAKPVHINPMYYKDRVKGMAITAAAGPLSNFVLAFLGMLAGVIIMVVMTALGAPSGAVAWVQVITQIFTQMNLGFMVFNLIPFPPLDGFKIFGMFMPRNVYYKILQYEHYIMYALIVLCLLGVFSRIIGTGVSIVYTFIFNAVMNIVGLFV